MYQLLVVLGIFIFLYSITCGKLERTPINGALVYVILGVVVGPLGLGWIHIDINAESFSLLAELTLALVLFTDASNASLDTLKKDFRIPVRMLLIGLPLTILLGMGAGVIIFGSLTFFEVAVLSAMLAPTDAALGKAVVSNKSVPARFREGLNVESGLNDGICVPILFIFLALAAQGAGHARPLLLLLEELGIGLVVGLGVTFIGAWLLKQGATRGWITKTWAQTPVIALAVISFAGAQWLGGSGFIAAFTGGLLFGFLAKQHKHALLKEAENTGDVLALLTWVIFGAVVLYHAVGHFSWTALLYAVLSLTVIRMLPVFISLTGLGLKTSEKLFLGWFGPRGLASIVFIVIVREEMLPGNGILSMTVVTTILLSVIAHGLTANPLANLFAKKDHRSNGQRKDVASLDERSG